MILQPNFNLKGHESFKHFIDIKFCVRELFATGARKMLRSAKTRESREKLHEKQGPWVKRGVQSEGIIIFEQVLR